MFRQINRQVHTHTNTHTPTTTTTTRSINFISTEIVTKRTEKEKKKKEKEVKKEEEEIKKKTTGNANLCQQRKGVNWDSKDIHKLNNKGVNCLWY